MVKKVIINADDLGFSKGVNEAVLKANTQGYLSHASLMANTKYFDHAISEVIPKCSSLKIGVHVNLTCAAPLSPQNLLSTNGELKNTFVTLLLKRKTKKVLEHLEKEIEFQILKIKNAGVNISHIDGHEHVHIIPSINNTFSACEKLMKTFSRATNSMGELSPSQMLSNCCCLNYSLALMRTLKR